MGNDIRKCYIELLVDERSTEKILRFLKENEDLIQNPRKKFHSTFYYSNYTPIFERERIVNEIKDSLPLTISPESYFFEVFGEENCLALRYENKRVRLLKKKITREGFRQLTEDFHSSLSYAEIEIQKKYKRQKKNKKTIIYPIFNPHITIAINFDKKDLEKLTGFNDIIIFDGISWTV